MTDKIACYTVRLEGGNVTKAKAKSAPQFIDGYATAAMNVVRGRVSQIRQEDYDNLVHCVKILQDAQKAVQP